MMDTTLLTETLDAIFGTLYENMDKDGLLFREQILHPNKIRLTEAEEERVWDVLRASGLAASIVGFGNRGKLELTPAGIQMMTRFGSYKQFLASQGNPAPQLTIQLADAGDPPDKQAEKAPRRMATPKKKRRSAEGPSE